MRWAAERVGSDPDPAPDVGRETGRDRLDGLRDLGLGQRAILAGEDEPEREAALVVGQRPATVAVEQVDRAQERPTMAGDRGGDVRSGPRIGHDDREVALDVRMPRRRGGARVGQPPAGQPGDRDLADDDPLGAQVQRVR